MRLPPETRRQIAALWELEAEWLVRYAMVRTGEDQSAAEDLVQTAFLAAAVQWSSLVDRTDDERRNWLRSVVHHKWVDGIRRSRKLERLDTEERERYAGRGPDLVDVVLARADLECCLEVIRNLPERRRQIAVLFFIEQYSAARIAYLLDLQPSGVRKHIAKARAALREAVKPVGTGEAEELPPREQKEEQA
ncbi:sigma-70 family RNA polymerase sigma factor [Streptomyces spinoverrucosus]|uniref:RNA polymerase sigma factor n=1 Tax=Streptomyces spinoverrucosus TaxID=284043 RepID=UPI0018C35523|nr:sigma-70 family RNA polymerase sigma factor [Streptomyces spinoverrucosus]MBG0850305.1 sigma-70 family RNA polymerase sigma factor [Streptomyces spinoverrucosus]